MLSLTTFYRSGAHRSDVYKWDAFVTSWRFYNRAWQPQRHDRLPETSGTLWIHRGALTNQRCSLATGCGIILASLLKGTSFRFRNSNSPPPVLENFRKSGNRHRPKCNRTHWCLFAWLIIYPLLFPISLINILQPPKPPLRKLGRMRVQFPMRNWLVNDEAGCLFQRTEVTAQTDMYSWLTGNFLYSTSIRP